MEDLIHMEKKKIGRSKKITIESLVSQAEELKQVEQLNEPVEEFQYSYWILRENIESFIREKPEDSKLVKMLKEWRNR